MGERVSTAPPELRGMATLILGHLGQRYFHLFSQPSLGLLQCIGLWVSLDYRGQMGVWFQRTGQTPFLASLCASC